MPGTPGHLVARFFDVVFARSLSGSERAAVDAWLDPELSAVFFAQTAADQRHGYTAALSLIAAGVDSRQTIQAGLMHDVGKRHSRLGVIARSIASILILLGLPLTERMRMYRDHGPIAARELGALGASSLVIDFAMHHHGARPPTIPVQTWNLLVAADEPPKPHWPLWVRITSGDT